MLIVKVSGHQLDDPAFVEALGKSLLAVKQPVVLVHGGGKEIKDLQNRLGIKPQLIDGLRVTDAESLIVVQMVLAGRVNKRLVAELSRVGLDAFGMSGVDRACIKAEKLHHPNGDLGQVGQVVSVRTNVFERLVEDGVLPVLSPVCYGADGSMFNVNADNVATALAVALEAEALVFISNVQAVLHNEQPLSHLTPEYAEQLIQEQVIIEGMIPKTRAALKAVAEGVRAVRITDLEGFRLNIGTTISSNTMPQQTS